MTPRRRVPTRERVALIKQFGERCGACGASLSGKLWHLDHIIPLAMGGDDGTGNYQPLCLPCHTAKTVKDVPAIAKAKRVEARNLGIKPERKIKSRGFAKAAPQNRASRPLTKWSAWNQARDAGLKERP